MGKHRRTTSLGVGNDSWISRKTFYVAELPGAQLGIDRTHRRGSQTAFVICIIGPTPAESTGNLQAPLIINYANMTGRQVILGDTEFSSRYPLV